MRTTTEKENMIHDIGIVSFVAYEMALYLDTHPMDREAMEYFNHYMRMKNQMMRDFAAKYWPLTLSTADTCSKEWKWALSPMPWEGGC